MKKKYRKPLRLAFIVVFLISTALLIWAMADNYNGKESYEDALALAKAGEKTVQTAPVETEPEETEPPREMVWVPEPIEDDPNLEELEQISLDALREINPDVLGWIWIPDTAVNYPLMQGEDNQYYLKHTWKNGFNSIGSIFLEYRNTPDMTDYNTIVYGHNLKSGAMFGGLKRFSKEDYWKAHPYVYVLTDDGIFRYEVFAAYKADLDSATYGLSFQQDRTRANFLIHAIESSEIETGIIPEKNDRILTLSTCSGSGYTNRWVVQARLKMIEEEKAA